MIICDDGSIMTPTKSGFLLMSSKAVECPACHTMAMFLVNHIGATTCVQCGPVPKENEVVDKR